MAIDGESFVYGVRDCKVAKLTADANPPTYDSFVDVPGIQNFDVTFKFQEKELKGDEITLDVHTKTESIELKVEHAKISQAAQAVLLGGTATTSATKNKFALGGDDVPNYFKIEAQVVEVDEDDADMHFVAYKAKVTDFQLGAKGEDYRTVSFTAKAIPCTEDRTKFYEQVENSTATEIA